MSNRGFIPLETRPSSDERLRPPRGGLALTGFSLIEILVVAAIIGLISTTVVISFGRHRLLLDETTGIFVADLRDAQTRAISSAKLNNYIPCGYGLTYLNATQYALYAGPNAGAVSCSSQNRNYNSGQDTVVFTRTFSDSRLAFNGPFSDIFFEPPDPKTYINNSSALTTAVQNITIQKVGGACPGDCRTVKVFISGKIEK